MALVAGLRAASALRVPLLLPPCPCRRSVLLLAPPLQPMSTMGLVASLIVGLPIGLYAWKATVAVATQDRMIYARHSRMIEPDRGRKDVASPESAGFTREQYEELELVTADRVRLHSWLFMQPEPARAAAPTLLYLQGNGGDIGHRLPLFSKLLRQTNANCLALSYRGYGKSSGAPSERGLRQDAMAALDWLGSPAAAALGVQRSAGVVAYGHSLGGAVAIALAQDLAAQRRAGLDGIIVENSFTSLGRTATRSRFVALSVSLTLKASQLGDMVDEIFPSWSVYPHLKPCLKSRWESLATVPTLPPSLPVLFVSGSADHEVRSLKLRIDSNEFESITSSC